MHIYVNGLSVCNIMLSLDLKKKELTSLTLSLKYQFDIVIYTQIQNDIHIHIFAIM